MRATSHLKRLVRRLECDLKVTVVSVRSLNRGYWKDRRVIRWDGVLKDGRRIESEDSVTACLRASSIGIRRPAYRRYCWQIDAEPPNRAISGKANRA